MTKRPVRKNKKYKQVIVKGTDKEADRARAAKRVGWRVSRSGKRYFENRSNRSDTDKERKYHGGVNRRAKPRKQAKQTSTRASRGLKTTRRVAPVRKRDQQKVRIVNKLIPTKYRGYRSSTIRYYKPRSKRKLTAAEFEARLDAEMRKIDLQDKEHCFGIDKYGNILFRVLGNEIEVAIPDYSWWSAHEEDRVIIVHNHPIHGEGDYNWWGASSPLSAADVKCATMMYDCRGVIACANGMYYCALVVDHDITPPYVKLEDDVTRLNREAIDYINQTYPPFDGQKLGESKADYAKRYYDYQHKRHVRLARKMSSNQAGYLTPVVGYRYFVKRY